MVVHHVVLGNSGNAGGIKNVSDSVVLVPWNCWTEKSTKWATLFPGIKFMVHLNDIAERFCRND
jgi:hypothetical protein